MVMHIAHKCREYYVLTRYFPPPQLHFLRNSSSSDIIWVTAIYITKQQATLSKT